jgi:hypothetical protein
MSKDLTTISPFELQAGQTAKLYPSEEVALLTDVLANGLAPNPSGNPDRDEMVRLPNRHERGMLQSRSRDLSSLLRPASLAAAETARIGEAVGMMLGGWRNLKEGNPAEIIAGYTMLLKELPVWAVVKACGEFARGEAIEVVNGVERRMSPDWAPSAARVYTVARDHITAQVAESNRLHRLLSCRKISVAVDPAARERVGALLKDFSGGMTERVRKERDADRIRIEALAQEARDRAAKIREDADRPILALYASLGLQPVRTQVGRLVHPDHLSVHERVAVPLPDSFDPE